MTKKYPESWCRVIAAALIKSYEAGYKDGQDPASEEPWLMSTTTILDSLEEAGMLKDIPEPLEIEYCTVHGARRNSIWKEKCNVSQVLHGSQSSPEGCTFIKMREVEK